ncbi:MAG: ABC transporter substrate-binding protein [Clostridia bacterium]|nr:ABC transporter substrate-binding protein [Clostridia bacterium]
MKKAIAIVMAVMMVFGLAACSGGSTQPASTGSSGVVIKVGATGPLTGGAAIYGQAVKNGAEIAVEEVNAKGGIQFEFNMQDDTHDPEKAQNAYNSLVDWGMDMMMGTVTSAPAEVTAANVYEDRYFFLTPSASSTNVIDGKDNVFQMCFTDPNQGSGSATYISENKMGSKIAIIWKNDDSYSTGIRNTFVEKAAELGLNIVAEETFTEATKTDFSVQVAKCQEAGADLVFLPMYYEPASLILNQASSAGYAPTWFGVDGMDGILTMEGFDTSLAEGVVVLTPYSADDASEMNQSFVKKYQEKFGEIPNQFAADGYDCIYAMYKAATEAGIDPASMDHSAICDAMVKQFTSMSFDGLTGASMTWAADGTVSKLPNAVVIQNGVYVGM